MHVVYLSIVSVLALSKEKVFTKGNMQFVWLEVGGSYLNKHICLSLLYIFIFSLQKRPPDNAFYVKTCHKNPKKTRWWYHDDNV